MLLKIRSEKHLGVLQECLQKAGFTSLEEFFLKRRRLEFALTDWERSQRQKQNWRENRWKYLKGIHKFHRSTRGKEFHNTLSRFLSSRDVASKLAYYQSAKDRERALTKVRECFDAVSFEKLDEYREFLIGITSAVTHALIEERYYEPDLNEAVEYKFFLAYLVDRYVDTLNKIIEGRDEEVDWEFWQKVAFVDVSSSQAKGDDVVDSEQCKGTEGNS